MQPTNNNMLSKLVKVIAKLVRTNPRDMVDANFLAGVESAAINTYRANHKVVLAGRKWLAPLYRPYPSTFVINKGAFLTVRDNGPTVDVEGIVQGDSITFTMKAQDWREKKPYFLQIPSNRIRGKLEMTVKHILKARKQQEKHQDE